MKLFISQPTGDRTDEKILAERNAAEQTVIEPETPPESTEAAVTTKEACADEAACSEPTAEKTDASAAEIAGWLY